MGSCYRLVFIVELAPWCGVGVGVIRKTLLKWYRAGVTEGLVWDLPAGRRVCGYM